MRFLLDQDVYATTLHFLRRLGHDVVPAAQIGLSQASDEDLLKEAQTQGRVLITRDRDFGALVFLKGLGGGVLYLRILPSTQSAVHAELARVIKMYSEATIKKRFIVIEPGGHRARAIQD